MGGTRLTEFYRFGASTDPVRWRLDQTIRSSSADTATVWPAAWEEWSIGHFIGRQLGPHEIDIPRRRRQQLP